MNESGLANSRPGRARAHVTEAATVTRGLLLLCADGITENLAYGRNHMGLEEALSKERSAVLLVDAAMKWGIKTDGFCFVSGGIQEDASPWGMSEALSRVSHLF